MRLVTIFISLLVLLVASNVGAQPATIVSGDTFGGGNSFSGPPGNVTVDFGVAGVTVQTNDVLVAFIVVFHDIHGTDINDFTAGLPASWTMVRNDPNPGTGSLHGPMYNGIASHVVTTPEGAHPVYNFSLSSAGATHNQGTVNVAVIRGSTGIEHITTFSRLNSSDGKITAPSVATDMGNELVLVNGQWGTGSGSTITSDNGLPKTNMNGNVQADATFYQSSTGLNSLAQGLTCFNSNDAFTAYQVSMAGVATPTPTPSPSPTPSPTPTPTPTGSPTTTPSPTPVTCFGFGTPINAQGNCFGGH